AAAAACWAASSAGNPATTTILPFRSRPSYGSIFVLLITYPFPAKTRFPVTSSASSGGPPRPPAVTLQSLVYSKSVVRGVAGVAAPPRAPPPPAPPIPRPPPPPAAGGAVVDALPPGLSPHSARWLAM